MNQFSYQALGLSLFLVLGTVAPAQSADPVNSVVSKPQMAPGGNVALPPQPPLTPAEGKVVLKEYQRAQYSELKAVEHRQKLELKELKASHGARQKEWDRRETEARHKFFAEHTNGPDRRAYIQDFIERRKSFLQLLNDERTQRTHEQEVRYNSVKSDQNTHLREFQESLMRGERPPARLWPASG
jgi:hypothetical protein